MRSLFSTCKRGIPSLPLTTPVALNTPAASVHKATSPLHLLRQQQWQRAAIQHAKKNGIIGVSKAELGDLTAPSATSSSASAFSVGPVGSAAAAAGSCTCGTCGTGAMVTPSRAHSTPSSSPANAAAAPVKSASEDMRVARDVANFVGGRLVQSLQREQPPRGSGIQPLLDYNKQWSGEIARLNPEYFPALSEQQTPQYLWIGCSDSRVPANEIVGLYPGDVFVHRNIANIVCNSDLNALAVLQYAIDCLKVEHVIVAGHYKCGGVTAALEEHRVGLADHWILHVASVKKRHWKRIEQLIPKCNRLDALCELNVIAQVEHVVDTHLIRNIWKAQNAEDAMARKEGRASKNTADNEVEIHGWVYGLEDGVVRPLLSLNRHSRVNQVLDDAVEALFWRYAQL